MIRNTYTKWFEAFWDQLLELRKVGPMRPLGSKPQARDACKAKKIGPKDVPFLLKAYIKQRDGIILARQCGADPAGLQDIVRWIRNERFDDEEHKSADAARGRPISKSARNAAISLGDQAGTPDFFDNSEHGPYLT